MGARRGGSLSGPGEYADGSPDSYGGFRFGTPLTAKMITSLSFGNRVGAGVSCVRQPRTPFDVNDESLHHEIGDSHGNREEQKHTRLGKHR